MTLVAQWRRIEAELPDGWAEAQLALELESAEQRPRATAFLGPAAPGGVGEQLRLVVHRGGAGIGPEGIRRLLGRLDGERIRGTLRLVGASAVEQPAEVRGAALGASWKELLVTLPSDWSDLLCEIELSSSDYLQRGALLLAPVNPTRYPGRTSFRFRVARRFGYGATPEMTRRCLERLDSEGISGRVTILRALSDTHNVATQGPVWYLEGKAV